jgi:hypothetical protein
MPAVARDIDSRARGGLNAVEALGVADLNFFSIDKNDGHRK